MKCFVDLFVKRDLVMWNWILSAVNDFKLFEKIDQMLNVWDGYVYEMIYANIFVCPILALTVYESFAYLLRFMKRRKRGLNSSDHFEFIGVSLMFTSLYALPIYVVVSTIYSLSH